MSVDIHPRRGRSTRAPSVAEKKVQDSKASTLEEKENRYASQSISLHAPPTKKGKQAVTTPLKVRKVLGELSASEIQTRSAHVGQQQNEDEQSDESIVPRPQRARHRGPAQMRSSSTSRRQPTQNASNAKKLSAENQGTALSKGPPTVASRDGRQLMRKVKTTSSLESEAAPTRQKQQE